MRWRCRGRFLARVESSIVVLSVYSLFFCLSSFFLRVLSHDSNSNLDLFSFFSRQGNLVVPELRPKFGRSTVVLKLNPT